MIRLGTPAFDGSELARIGRVLDSGMLVQGRCVDELEAAAGAVLGGGHVVAISSGTAALHIAMMLMGVGPGDVVLAPTYSWPATANVIELQGAATRFVDVQGDTGNMDAAALGQTLDDLDAAGMGDRVKAVIVVHAFGMPADMAEISSVARAHSLPVIEDAACALGASYAGEPVGTHSPITCFSFHPRKILTTGEGGLLVTPDPDLARMARTLRNHGLAPEGPPGNFVAPGLNYRMNEIEAAIGCAQFERFEDLLQTRRQLARRYDQLLEGTAVLAPPVRSDRKSSYQAYVVRLPVRTGGQRDAIIRRMLDEGVETTIGTWHIPLTPYYRARYGHEPGQFPSTDRLFDCALTLPLHAGVTAQDQEQVIAALLRVIEQEITA